MVTKMDSEPVQYAKATTRMEIKDAGPIIKTACIIFIPPAAWHGWQDIHNVQSAERTTSLNPRPFKEPPMIKGTSLIYQSNWTSESKMWSSEIELTTPPTPNQEENSPEENVWQILGLDALHVNNNAQDEKDPCILFHFFMLSEGKLSRFLVGRNSDVTDGWSQGVLVATWLNGGCETTMTAFCSPQQPTASISLLELIHVKCRVDWLLRRIGILIDNFFIVLAEHLLSTSYTCMYHFCKKTLSAQVSFCL